MRILVSIHDVTPMHRAAVEQLWQLCRQHGQRPALLCVPHWHGSHRLDDDAGFVRWLQQRVEEGADILLHGWRHDEVGASRTWADHWRAWGRTRREAEFLVLDAAAAEQRLEEGLAMFRRLELAPLGFVAPAWLARPGLTELVGRLGFRLYEDATAVYGLARGRAPVVYPAPALRWSARTRLRSAGSVAVARARWALGRHTPLMRLALHPGDLDGGPVEGSLRAELARWSAGRLAVRYRDLAAAAEAVA